MDPKPRATTVAAYLAARLASLGARHIFAVPGDYVAAFLDTVDSSGLLRRVAAVNELEAGYAADGYARYGRLGAMAVTYGVGAFGALNAVAGSYVERLPVVVINGSPSHANRRLGRDRGILFHHMTGDLDANLEAYRRVTVAAEVLASGVEAPKQIDRALRAAIARHRPVYIEGLKDIWDAACPAQTGPIEVEPATSAPDPLAEAVDAAWALLSRANRGVIWAGIELRRKGLLPLLEDLLQASGWPLMTTLLAKGLLAETDRRFRGVYAGPASAESVREEMEGADAILALGTLITDDYLDLVAVAYDQMIVAFDGEVRVGSRIFPGVALEDFARGVLERFLDAGPTSRCPLPLVWPDLPTAPGRHPITFDLLISSVTQFLDPKMILVVDEGHALYVSASMRIHSRGGYASQAAWGSIGYAAAGAIGIGLASRCRPVVLIGDGGLQMTCQALSTLQRERLGAIVLIVENGVYGIEQALVDRGPFGDPPTAFKRYNLLPIWDYAELARSIGGLGFHVSTVAGLRNALRRAKVRKEDLTVIAVAIDQHELPHAVRRLAEDTGYPRHEPCRHQVAANRRRSFRKRIKGLKA